MLEHFARHRGRVLSRDWILDSVWGEQKYVTRRSVDVYVRRVREKIESDPESRLLENSPRSRLSLRLCRSLAETVVRGFHIENQ